MSTRIGIDIGGVLRGRQPAGLRYSNRSQPPNPYALETVASLSKKYGKENIYIVSKCSEETEGAMLNWLRNNNFFDTAGIDQMNVYFCRLRTDKALIASDLKLRYFVDDRAEVLESMKGIVKRRVMYSASGSYEDSGDTGIIKLSSWREIESDLDHFLLP